MSDDYPSALAAIRTGTPLTPLQYASLLLSQTEQELRTTSYELDNSSGYWDNTQTYGPLAFAHADSTSKTVTLAHATYVGPQQSGTISALNLPVDALLRMADAINAQAGYAVVNDLSFPGWAIIVLGVGVAAAGLVLEPFTGGASTPLLYLGIVIAVAGVVTTLLQNYNAFVTPEVTNSTCNSTSTSCCYDVVSKVTGNTAVVCVDCPNSSSVGCTSSNTQLPTGIPSITATLEGIAVGVLAIAAVGIGSYAAYKYVSNKPLRTQPYFPPRSPAPPPQRPLSERSGLLPSTYRTVRRTTGQAYQRTKNYLIGS